MTAYSLPCMSVDRLSYIICLTLPRLQFPGHHGGVIFGTLPGLAKNYHRKHDYNMGSFRELGFPKTKTMTKGANFLTGEGIILTADPQVMMGKEGNQIDAVYLDESEIKLKSKPTNPMHVGHSGCTNNPAFAF